MTKCANCGTFQGPFSKVYNSGPVVCKNTKELTKRISECVVRRDKTYAQEERNQYL